MSQREDSVPDTIQTQIYGRNWERSTRGVTNNES